MAFERAREEGDPAQIDLALDVVRISVLSVVLLAPLGAICMMNTGPFLLNRITIEEHERERQLSYLRIISLQPVRKRKKREKSTGDAVNTHSPALETAL